MTRETAGPELKETGAEPKFRPGPVFDVEDCGSSCGARVVSIGEVDGAGFGLMLNDSTDAIVWVRRLGALASIEANGRLFGFGIRLVDLQVAAPCDSTEVGG